MATPIKIDLQFLNGIGRSGQVTTPDQYKFPEGYFATPVVPLTRMYPLGDSVTPLVSHHRCAYPNMPWECPVRVLGGTGLRWAVIEQAPAGMTIGNGWVENIYGDLILDGDSLNLKWNTPVAGTYPIRVRVYDHNTSVVFRWTLVCDPANFWFWAPTALGNGNGQSPENAASIANTYIADSTPSPSRNKILVSRGGDYAELETRLTGNPVKGYEANSSFHSINVIGYPNEVAVFHSKFKTSDNYRFFGNLEWSDMVLTSGGVIFNDPIRHGSVEYKLTFRRITADNSTNNQCCINPRGTGGTSFWRNNLVTTQCNVIDCNVALMESYNVGSHLVDRNIATKSNNDPLTLERPQFIFPKADIKLCEISFNRYDCPNVVSSNVLYCQNSSYSNTDETIILAYYNFVRGANGTQGININKEAGQQNNISKCYFSRNTMINANVYPYIGEKGVGGGSFSILENEVYQNSFGGVAPSSTPPLGNYTEVNKELYATSGIVDVNGRIVNTTYRGRRGSQVWRP